MSLNCEHCVKLLDICNSLSSKVDNLMRVVNAIANTIKPDALVYHAPDMHNPSNSTSTSSNQQPVIQQTTTLSRTRSQTTASSSGSRLDNFDQGLFVGNSPGKKKKKGKTIATTPVLQVTDATSIDLVGSGPALPDLKIAEPRKMLYISNLDPLTSIDRISTLIYSTFGIKPILCSKLVSKERSLETLEYVSFKVLVPEIGFVKFLDSTKWPVGVIVREFVQKTKNLIRPATLI